MLDIDLVTERFDAALFLTLQNLGPQLIARAQFSLTQGQVFVLHFIQQNRDCNVSKLADKMEVNPSAITVMLDRLENRGFVVRKRDSNDRRVVITHITESGEKALKEVMRVRKQIIQHCLVQVNPDELDSFVRTLERIAMISTSMDIQSMIHIDQPLEG